MTTKKITLNELRTLVRQIIKEEDNRRLDYDIPFAVFVLSYTDDGMIAATTRAADKGEKGRIGLPGGKVDPGEDPVDACYREAYEEGWKIDRIDPNPIHKKIIDGNIIWWYTGYNPQKLNDYKEMHRIKPITVSKSEISKSGYGNRFIANI